MMKVLFILDDAVFGEKYLEIAAAAFAADMIWYRIKNKPAAEVFSRARSLRRLLPDKTLILSERGDIAEAAGFDGVHLNAESIAPDLIKRIFPNLITGYSAHSVEECRFANVDYCTLSPIFDTPKNYDVKPLGMVKAPAENVFALGGVKISMADDFKKLGYAGIAGIRIISF